MQKVDFHEYHLNFVYPTNKFSQQSSFFKKKNVLKNSSLKSFEELDGIFCAFIALQRYLKTNFCCLKTFF